MVLRRIESAGRLCADLRGSDTQEFLPFAGHRRLRDHQHRGRLGRQSRNEISRGLAFQGNVEQQQRQSAEGVGGICSDSRRGGKPHSLIGEQARAEFRFVECEKLREVGTGRADHAKVFRRNAAEAEVA